MNVCYNLVGLNKINEAHSDIFFLKNHNEKYMVVIFCSMQIKMFYNFLHLRIEEEKKNIVNN